ncbi:MAG TPA: hypothetical protein VGE32_01575 [Cellvibrio sp.]
MPDISDYIVHNAWIANSLPLTASDDDIEGLLRSSLDTNQDACIEWLKDAHGSNVKITAFQDNHAITVLPNRILITIATTMIATKIRD